MRSLICTLLPNVMKDDEVKEMGWAGHVECIERDEENKTS
jgi:hypothetical protein